MPTIKWVGALIVMACALVAQPAFSADQNVQNIEQQSDSKNTEQQAAPVAKEKTPQELRQESRQTLEAAAKKAGLNMTRVQKFCDALEDRAATYYLTDQDIQSAYTGVTELIETSNAKPYCTQKERNQLAEEVLHNLAYPREIDQGSHPTCNVTTLEVYMASRHPGVYADLVKQVAITQEYKTSAGEVIKLPQKALNPGSNEKTYDIDHPNQDKRNWASQFVEHTLINGVYQTSRFKVNGKVVTDRQYILGPQTTHTEWDPQYGKVTVYDTEDQLCDLKGNQLKNSQGQKIDGPEFTGDEVLASSEMVLGYKMPYVESPYKVGNQPWVYDLPTAKRLLDWKKNKQLPCVGVPTKGGIHVQTIHDVFVDSKGQCWVLIDNQHGAKEDGWVKLEDLHKSQKNANYDMKPLSKRPQP